MMRRTARGKTNPVGRRRKTHQTTESTEITETRSRRSKEMEVIDLNELNRLSGCPVGVLINFNLRQLSQGAKRFRI
jgi:hypothetical protein